jgi:hypothetical protein
MISKDKSLYFDCLDFTPVVSAEEMPSEINKKYTGASQQSWGKRFLAPLRLCPFDLQKRERVKKSVQLLGLSCKKEKKNN